MGKRPKKRWKRMLSLEEWETILYYEGSVLLVVLFEVESFSESCMKTVNKL